MSTFNGQNGRTARRTDSQIDREQERQRERETEKEIGRVGEQHRPAHCVAGRKFIAWRTFQV